MNNTDLSKLKEYSKDDIHEMIINGEIDHDFICEYISKRDKVYNMLIDKVNELQEENKKLKEKYKATNKGLRKVLSKRLKWKRRYYKEKYIKKELKKWLEEIKEDRKYENDVYRFTAYDDVLDKIKELEEGAKNESRY